MFPATAYMECGAPAPLLRSNPRPPIRTSKRTIPSPTASGSLYGEGERILLAQHKPMQELALTQPTSAARAGWSADAESKAAATAALRREFEERLAECGPLAFRVARGVLRNAADAEDVAQEALLRAYRRFERLHDRNSFRAWLVRITFRLALDRARSANRREQRETMWARQRPQSSTEDVAASSEFQAHLDRAVDELSPKLRLVLLLAAMEEHPLDDVAQMLGLPIGTVKSRLFAAKKQLVEKLQCHVKNTKSR
jgi:RNA polymerase sigma-70 factor, ECF subfamily